MRAHVNAHAYMEVLLLNSHQKVNNEVKAQVLKPTACSCVNIYKPLSKIIKPSALQLSTMSHKKPYSPYVLLSWPEEDSFSIISARKILSSLDELESGAICKVQNYEQCLTRVLAVGSESEMDCKLLEVIKEDKLTAIPSPKKRKASINFLPDSTSPGAQPVQSTLNVQSPRQLKPFHPPEPDTEWYRHTLTPRKPKQVKVHSHLPDTGKEYILIQLNMNIAFIID